MLARSCAILLERFERDHGSLAAPLQTGDGRARAGHGPATEHRCDAHAPGGGSRTRGGAAGPPGALMSSGQHRHAGFQSKWTALGILSDIHHAAVAHTFVRNVPERSSGDGARWPSPARRSESLALESFGMETPNMLGRRAPLVWVSAPSSSSWPSRCPMHSGGRGNGAHRRPHARGS